MKKIKLIIRREYLSRVRKKSFIVTTILLPLGMFGLMAAIIFFTMKSESFSTIGVIDETGYYFEKMDSINSSFALKKISSTSLDVKKISKENELDILLHLYAHNSGDLDSIKTYTESSLSIKASEYIEDEINRIFQNQAFEMAGLNIDQIDSIKSSQLEIKSENFEKKETNTAIAAMLGYGMGFLMYMVIFIYGVGVMRGVMEEKTNRIAEVIVSSVTPFQLMMGKIIGIALVGLTQLFMWMALLGILNLALAFFMPVLSPEMITDTMASPEASKALAEASSAGKIQEMYAKLSSQNWFLIIGSFIFYFLGGYLLYAALFAAVGSLVNEDPQDAQQLTMPITLPIVFAFIILATSANDPHSGLAVFGSIFPLTSPIVMLGRIPYMSPDMYWQIGLSMGLLVLGFIGTVWISAKIYRIGILLYGKKVGWKEIFKWLKRA